MVQAPPKPTKAPVISVPTPQEEQLRVGKVGIIAAVGLAIGIAWPKLIGLHLAPEPPSDAPPSTASPATAPASATAATSSTPSAPSAVVAPTPSEPEPSAATVRPPKVTLAQVVSCRSKDGDRETHCDTPALDSIIQTPLQSLVACDAAENARGVLSLGLDVDFETQKFEHLTVGKSTTLPTAVARQLLHCGEKELGRLSLEGIEHKKSSYRIFYKVEFGASSAPNPAAEPDATEAPASNELVSASGRVTVTWDAALVRAKPRDGEVLARVLGGTRLTVTGRQGEWYRVKYDGKGSEGWVYKAAIGL